MNENKQKDFVEEDVVKQSVNHLIGHRFPWLILGLLGGILTTFIVARYEEVLAADVRLAFFMPIIVYLSDALGTQTETIYVRELSERKRFSLSKYIFKETLVGLGLGTISGTILGIFSASWLSSPTIGLVVGLTILINLSTAPILAISIPHLIKQRHTDPALGSGPIATVIQDLISLIVYFLIAGLIIF